MKYKFLIIIMVLIVVAFGSGITYSYFTSGTNMTSTTQSIAKFIFNAEEVDELNLSLVDLNPGDSKDYKFSVSNNYLGDVSNVTIGYQLIVKTYHLVPLEIKLYKINDQSEEKVLTCDETYTRNNLNEVACYSPVINMGYVNGIVDNYKLTVKFPSEYNDEVYANLVDYINVEINSWQELGG